MLISFYGNINENVSELFQRKSITTVELAVKLY